MRIVGVDGEGKDESATLVHSWEGHASVYQQRGVFFQLLAFTEHL